MSKTGPIRLLFLLPERLPTHRADVTVLFGKYLPLHGITGTMVGRGTSGNGATAEGFSIRTSSPRGGRMRRELNFWFTCWRQLLRVQVDQYDVIQVRDMVSIGLFAALAARVRGISFVYWMSFLMSEGRIQNAKAAVQRGQLLKGVLLWVKGTLEKAILYKLLLPAAAHVFVQSEEMARYVGKCGILTSKLSAVPMGVDFQKLHVRRQMKERTAAPDFAIGYLGTMDAQRNLAVLIEALSLVKVQFPNARLLLVGDSENPKDVVDLKSYAALLGVENAVEFTGWLPNDQGWVRICEVDVCISPFPRGKILDTNSPTKVIEYLALGLPAIGNDNPDQKEVLENSQAGWLVTEHSATSYARAILDVFGDLQSARLRAARGPEYVRANRSYEKISDMVAKQYRQLD